MRRLQTVVDVADMLNVTTRTVYDLIYSGRLRAAKIGGKWAIRYEWVEEFIDASIVDAS